MKLNKFSYSQFNGSKIGLMSTKSKKNIITKRLQADCTIAKDDIEINQI